MNPKNFFGELKRRNVYKVAVAYAIVGWLLVQIATQVFPFLEIPIWVVRLVIVLVAAGSGTALGSAGAPAHSELAGICSPFITRVSGPNRAWSETRVS